MKQFFASPFWLLRLGLIAVFVWFGINEVLRPHIWTGWVPSPFLNTIPLDDKVFLAKNFVFLHGVISLIASFLLSVSKTLRWGAILMAVLLLPIFSFGINEITMRDFAILTGALTLFFFYKKYTPSL